MKIEREPKAEIAADLVVSDTQRALSAIDEALLAHTQLFLTTLQAAKTQTLRIDTTQRLYSSLDDTVRGILDSRKAMADSIGTLRSIARAAGLEERLEGCPDGFPDLLVAPSAKVEPVRVAA